MPSALRQMPAMASWGSPFTRRVSRPLVCLMPKFSVSVATTGIISPVRGQGR